MAESVSRRNVLKWSGALAAAGIVGIGLGFGADLLVRPNTTKTSTVTQSGSATTVTKTGSATTVTQTGPTTTQTVTTTVTAPPPTISYVPPLSPEVQNKVDAYISNKESLHTGETISYAVASEWPPSGTGYYFGGLCKVRTKNGVITAIEPDDTINPNINIEDKAISWDSVMQQQVQQRTSARLYAYAGFINHPERLHYPMKRVSGNRGYPGGSFVRISWSEALSTIATQMKQTQQKYGNYSINNNPLSYWFGCGAGGWGCDSTEAQAFSYRFVYGTGYGIPCGYTDSSEWTNMFNAKLIILVGWCNITNDFSAGYYVRLAREKGIPIIAIDPRYTETAEALADQWIPIRVSTDAALGLAIANVLFKQNLYDQDYVSKFVEPTGFQNFKDYVLGNTAGPDGSIDRTPEWAASITGIPADTITALATLYASSKPVYLAVGNAVSSKQPRGENPIRVYETLQAMTGNTGIVGGTACSFGGEVSYPIKIPAANIGTSPGTFSLPLAPGGNGIYEAWRLPDVILQRQNLDAGTITETQYDNLIGNKPGNPVPNIHMNFDSGSVGNQRPQVERYYEACSTLDFNVSFANHGMDPTAQTADIMLPVAAWVENESHFYQVGASNRFIYQPKIVDPPGETKTMTWIYLQLAQQLGFGDKYSSALVNVPVNTSWPDPAWDSAWESLNEAAYNTWAALDGVAQLNPPSWSDFRKTNVFTFPVAPLVHTPKTAFNAEIQQGTPFPDNDYHKSGKIEVWSNWLATTDMTTSWYGGSITPMGQWEPVWQSYWTPAEFQKYPLLVTTAHSQMRMHNWTDANPLLGDVTNFLRDPLHSGDMYNAVLYISPVDAAARGIQTGDQVRIYNDAGQAVVTAEVSPWLTPGIIHLPEGRWGDFINEVDRRGNANTLTYADRVNPSCSFPHITICEVEQF